MFGCTLLFISPTCFCHLFVLLVTIPMVSNRNNTSNTSAITHKVLKKMLQSCGQMKPVDTLLQKHHNVLQGSWKISFLIIASTQSHFITLIKTLCGTSHGNMRFLSVIQGQQSPHSLSRGQIMALSHIMVWPSLGQQRNVLLSAWWRCH